jgi:hypothetical protein
MCNGGHVVLALALLVSARVNATETDLDRVLALLAEHTQGHVSFVEQDYLGVLDRPVQTSGELLYERPDRLEKRTLVPRLESLILEKGTLTIQSRRHTRQLALQDYPQIAPFIESIRATLAGDRAALEQTFQLHFEGSVERWTLELIARDKKLQRIVRAIRIEGARDELHAVNILQADGDRSIMRLGAAMPP